MLVSTIFPVRVAGRLLIDCASAQIPTGARVGLVGRNGTGKTTLFHVIAGDLARSTARSRSATGADRAPCAGGAEWAAEPDRDGPCRDIERMQLLAEAETTRIRIASPRCRPGWWTSTPIPRRRVPPRFLAGLGFSVQAQGRACAEFSGGWRMRVALAAVLFAQPDICCSTSRPIISISKAPCGWRSIFALSTHGGRHQPRPRSARQCGRSYPASRQQPG